MGYVAVRNRMNIGLPKEIPVMTLPGTVFFPHTLLPLHIFEQRYRRMLEKILNEDRIFAVAALDTKAAAQPDTNSPPCPVATAGLIRMCQTNDDGTSNLLLQGFTRIRIDSIIQESPYRIIRVRPLNTSAGAEPDRLAALRRELIRLAQMKSKLGGEVPDEVMQMLDHIDDPDAMSDLAAYTLCDDPALKQALLESVETKSRLLLIIRKIKVDLSLLRLSRKLQGDLDDDQIADN
jgi:Lon protease-like protein